MSFSKPLRLGGFEISPPVGIAIVVGAFVVGAFFYFSSRGAAVTNNNNNNASQNASGATANRALFAGAGQQPLPPSAVAAAARSQAAPAPPARVALPSRTDDLAQLVALGKHKQWPMMLHTNRMFLVSLKDGQLAEIVRNFPNLLLVHQLESATSEVETADMQLIRDMVRGTNFQRHQVLLCTTEKGPEAMVRQHEPALLLSENKALCNFISAFIPFAVHVDAFTTGDSIKIEMANSGASKPTAGAAAGAGAANRLYVVSSVAAVLKA